MSQQSTMIANDNAVTTIDRSYTPQYVLIGAVDTDNPVKKLEVSIGGNDFQNLTGQTAVQAFSKLNMQGLLGADVKVGQVFRIANGFNGYQTSQIRLTNSGITTPAVYYFSMRKADGKNVPFEPVMAGQETIQETDSKVFQGTGFTHLIFDATNLDYVNIDYVDGHSEKMSSAELCARFAMLEVSDADGKLAGLQVIENYGDIAELSIWTSGGSITVSKCKL